MKNNHVLAKTPYLPTMLNTALGCREPLRCGSAPMWWSPPS